MNEPTSSYNLTFSAGNKLIKQSQDESNKKIERRKLHRDISYFDFALQKF